MKTIQFKNQKLSRTVVKNNILRVWNQTSSEQRFDWYLDAFSFAEELSVFYDVDVNKVCGIIAALSPVKKWSENSAKREKHHHKKSKSPIAIGNQSSFYRNRKNQRHVMQTSF